MHDSRGVWEGSGVHLALVPPTENPLALTPPTPNFCFNQKLKNLAFKIKNLANHQDSDFHKSALTKIFLRPLPHPQDFLPGSMYDLKWLPEGDPWKGRSRRGSRPSASCWVVCRRRWPHSRPRGDGTAPSSSPPFPEKLNFFQLGLTENHNFKRHT